MPAELSFVPFLMNSRSSLLLFATLLLLNGCAAFHSPPAKASLPQLMVQRLGWMDQVAQAKQARSLPVNDPKREAELLQSMMKLGTSAGLPAASVKAFFTGQMQAAKERQKDWLKTHPPASQEGWPVPDLARTIRPALDEIGRLMIAELAKSRGSKDVPEILAEARHELTKAGCSESISAPAIEGLRAGLQ